MVTIREAALRMRLFLWTTGGTCTLEGEQQRKYAISSILTELEEFGWDADIHRFFGFQKGTAEEM